MIKLELDNNCVILVYEFSEIPIIDNRFIGTLMNSYYAVFEGFFMEDEHNTLIGTGCLEQEAVDNLIMKAQGIIV